MTLDIRLFLQPRAPTTATPLNNQNGDTVAQPTEPPSFNTAYETLLNNVQAVQSMPDHPSLAKTLHYQPIRWRDPCLCVISYTYQHHTTSTEPPPPVHSQPSVATGRISSHASSCHSQRSPPPTPPLPPPCHDPTVHRTVFDPRGELLIAATAHGTVSLWDVDALRDAAHTTSPPPPLLCLHTGVRLSDAAWDPVQDTRIAVASHSCADVFVFDLERCKVGFCTCLTCCVHDHLSQSAPTSVFKSPALAAATMLGHSRTGRFTLAATGVAAGGQVGHSSVARDVHQ